MQTERPVEKRHALLDCFVSSYPRQIKKKPRSRSRPNCTKCSDKKGWATGQKTWARRGSEQTWIMAEIGGSVMTFRLFCYDYTVNPGPFFIGRIAGNGNRTRMASLEGWNFTIKLCPRAGVSCRAVATMPTHFSNAVATKVALWPPKPNELFKTTRTVFSRATFGV